jgi:hypothetical protein
MPCPICIMAEVRQALACDANVVHPNEWLATEHSNYARPPLLPDRR